MFRTITPIFSVVLAIAMYFFFTGDIFTEIKTIQAETTEYEVAVQKGIEYNQKLESLLATKRSFSPLDSERVATLVPTDLDEVRVLVDLEAMAQTHKMLLGNIEVENGEVILAGVEEGVSSTEVGMRDFASADISFGLIGTYDQFRALLADIEKSLVLMEITNIDFIATEGSLQQFDVTIRVYSLLSAV